MPSAIPKDWRAKLSRVLLVWFAHSGSVGPDACFLDAKHKNQLLTALSWSSPKSWRADQERGFFPLFSHWLVSSTM